MNHPLSASYYADRAVACRTTVLENVQLAQDTYRVRIDCPEIARRILPGQFVMLRITAADDPLLARPLALYDTFSHSDGRPAGVDLVYLVVGKMTRLLATSRDGDDVSVWGPLGNGFAPSEWDASRPDQEEESTDEHLIMVAGGIGQTPFVALANEALGHRLYGDPARRVLRRRRVTLCYGVRTRALAAGISDFEQIGVDVRLSSDDGSVGHHGLVTDLLQELLRESTPPRACRVVCCGPEPMMEAVAKQSLAANVPCQVSLETPMACGIGICFSCVVPVRKPEGGWDYKRTCVDGPVFSAESLEWSP